MQTKRIPVIAGTAAAVAGLMMFAIKPAASQDNGTWFTQDVRDAANGILSSGVAQFLSGTGVTALERQSGRLGSINAATTGSTVNSPPIQSNRFEVMVNDPADDVFASFDVTSHSETAVAAFGDNVVVAFNDSTGFVTSRSGMGYGQSSDGGA